MFHSRLPFPDRLDVDPSDGGDSGASTPPLWPTSPHDTPSGRGQVLSPASRTQAILQGQRELMEMMRNIPESCHELSLKDLVELPRPPPRLIPVVEKRPSVDEYYSRRGQGYGNRKTTMTMAMGRSGSMGKGQQQQQEGLLLKMVLPVHTGVGGARGRRKQGKERSEEDCSEECSRKQVPDSESGDSLSSSTIGGSSGKSSGSGSSCGSRRSNNAIRHERRVEEGCCSFLRRKRR